MKSGQIKKIAIATVSELSGVNIVRRAVRAPIDHVQIVGGGLLNLARIALAPGHRAEAVNPSEAFAAEAALRGLDESALTAMTEKQWGVFAGWWLVLCAVTALGLICLRGYLDGFGLPGVVFSLAPVLPTSALAIRAAFYHWQLRHRRLGSFAEWVRTPKEWWPPGRTAPITLGILIVGLAALSSPGVVYAAAALPVGTPTSDLAQQIIAALIPSDGSKTGFTAAIFTFAAIVSAAGSFMLLYAILMTTVLAASHGEVLKDRISAASVVSTVTAFGLILPVTGGLPAIDLTIGEIASISSTSATDAWMSFVGNVTSDQGGTPPGILPALGGIELAQEALRADVCEKVIIAEANGWQVQPQAVGAPIMGGAFVRPFFAFMGDGDDGHGQQVWAWGRACGAIAIDTPATSSSQAVLTYSKAKIQAVDSLVQAVITSGLATQIQISGTEVADAWKPMPSNILTTLAPIARAYDSAMLTASSAMIAAQTAAARQKLASTAEAAGWTAAAEYWRTFAQLQSQAVHAVDAADKWNAPVSSPQAKGIEISEDTIKVLNKTYEAYDAELLSEHESTNTASALDLTKIGDENAILTRIFASADKGFAQMAINWMRVDSTDPMQNTITDGAILGDIGEGMFVGGAAVAVLAGNGVSSVTGLGKVFDWIAPEARLVMNSALLLSFVNQYLLPALPSIAMQWAIVGWTLSICEMLVMAALWPLLMIRLEGKDLFNQVQKPGLVILFNFFFKPILIILGLISAYYVDPLAIAPITKYFSSSFIGQQGGLLTGVMGILGGIALKQYLEFQTHSRVLTLIHVIPDKLPGWIGMGASGFGEAESHSRSMTGIIAGGQGASRAMGKASSGGGGNDRGSPASKLPSAGGEGASISPIGDNIADKGAAFSGGDSHWTKATGGSAGLSEGQRGEAQKAYGEWAEDNPAAAAKHGFDGYVGYAQAKEAAKAKGGDDTRLGA